MLSAHERYWWNHVFGWGIYVYNSTDDGPECEIITRILATHPELGPQWRPSFRDFLRDIFGT